MRRFTKTLRTRPRVTEVACNAPKGRCGLYMLDVPDLDVADFFRDVADSENWTLRTGFFGRCGFFDEKLDVADLTLLDVAD